MKTKHCRLIAIYVLVFLQITLLSKTYSQEGTNPDGSLKFVTYGVVTSNDGTIEGVNQAGVGHISFDATGSPIGPWRNVSTEGKIMHMLLIQNLGQSEKRFIIGFSGSICGDSGKILSFYGSNVTLADAGNFMQIIKNEIADGTLILTASNGQTFWIYDLNAKGGKIRTTQIPYDATLITDTNESPQLIKHKLKMDEDMKRLFPAEEQTNPASNNNTTTNFPSIKTNDVIQKNLTPQK